MRTLAILAVAAMAGTAFTGAAQAQTITISNWDGYMPADMLERFTEETGIEVELALHATNEEIMGKVVAGQGRGYDVLFVSSPFAEALNALDLIVELDHSLIPNLSNLYPQALELQHDPGNTFSVPYAWGSTGLCYRSDLVAEAPDSWMDLLEPSDEVTGKTTMLSTDRWLMGSALLALGHSVNTDDPAEIEEARNLLIETKRTLLSYDDTTFYSKLVSGEALMVQAWDGWCNYGIAENPDIEYVIPEEGSDLWVDAMVVTSASENKEAAHKFIDFVLEAENGAWVPENILYKVPNKAAMDALDPALIEQYPNLAMSPEELMSYEQLRDLGETQKAYTQAVTEIMASQ